MAYDDSVARVGVNVHFSEGTRVRVKVFPGVPDRNAHEAFVSVDIGASPGEVALMFTSTQDLGRLARAIGQACRELAALKAVASDPPSEQDAGRAVTEPMLLTAAGR